MAKKTSENDPSVRPFGADVVAGKSGEIDVRAHAGRKVGEHPKSDRIVRPFGVDVVAGKPGEIDGRAHAGHKVGDHRKSDRSVRPFGADVVAGRQDIDVRARPFSQKNPPTSN
jgi:hypothetical protein